MTLKTDFMLESSTGFSFDEGDANFEPAPTPNNNSSWLHRVLFGLCVILLSLVALPLLLLWGIIGWLCTRDSKNAMMISSMLLVVLFVLIFIYDLSRNAMTSAFLSIANVMVISYIAKQKQTWKQLASLYVLVGISAVVVYFYLNLIQNEQDEPVDERSVEPLINISRPRDPVGTIDDINEVSDLSTIMLIVSVSCGLWITITTHGFWLEYSENKLLVAESALLRAFCNRRVVQFIDDNSGLATIQVLDEYLDGSNLDDNISVSSNSSSIDAMKINKNDDALRSDGSDDNTLNSLSMTSPPIVNKKKQNLVLIHGYASASGYWGPCLSSLQESFNVWCVDLPGTGRSNRDESMPGTCEGWYRKIRTKLDEWRSSIGLEKFLICGHSLGAHIAASYAINYPERCQHLILASPVGVHLPPVELRDYMAPSMWSYDFAEEMSDVSTMSNFSLQKNFPLFKGIGFHILSLLWRAQFSPMDFIRYAGPVARPFFYWAIERRKRWAQTSSSSFLHRLTDKQLAALVEYTYQHHCAPACGERMLDFLLIPGAFAKMPLIVWLRGPLYDGGGDMEQEVDVTEEAATDEERGLNANSSLFSAQSRHLKCPVSFVYGDKSKDWTNAEQGRKLSRQLNKEGISGNCYSVEHAGHILYLENPLEFSKILAKIAKN